MRALLLVPALLLAAAVAPSASGPDADGDGIPDAHDLKPRDPSPVRLRVTLEGYALLAPGECDLLGRPDPYLAHWRLRAGNVTHDLPLPDAWRADDHEDNRPDAEDLDASVTVEASADARDWTGGRRELPRAVLEAALRDHDLLSRDDAMDLDAGEGAAAGVREYALHLEEYRFLLSGDQPCSAQLAIRVEDDAALEDVRRAVS